MRAERQHRPDPSSTPTRKARKRAMMCTFRSARTLRIVELLPAHRDAEIAGMVECSRERVRQVRLKTGIPAPSKITPDLKEKIRRIRRMTKSGRTATEMAAALHIPSTVVHRLAKRHGIKVIKGTPGVGVDAARLNQLKVLLDGGSSYSAAALQLGIHVTTAFRWARRLGLKKRLNREKTS